MTAAPTERPVFRPPLRPSPAPSVRPAPIRVPRALAMTHATVRPGDTLSQLAVRHYGNAARWPVIARANGIADPRKLAVGTRLVIPVVGGEPARVATAPRATTPARVAGRPSTGGRDVRVTLYRGLTLSHLALRYYGSARLWGPIARANGIRNTRRIPAGTLLLVPGVTRSVASWSVPRYYPRRYRAAYAPARRYATPPAVLPSAVTIRQGETLAGLARRYYGSTGRWRDIARVNGIDDPTRIPAGTRLALPPRDR